jgi:hypothetical protein
MMSTAATKLLVRCPSRILITTNYDPALEEAARWRDRAGSDRVRVPTAVRGDPLRLDPRSLGETLDDVADMWTS